MLENQLMTMKRLFGVEVEIYGMNSTHLWYNELFRVEWIYRKTLVLKMINYHLLTHYSILFPCFSTIWYANLTYPINVTQDFFLYRHFSSNMLLFKTLLVKCRKFEQWLLFT